MSMQADEQMLLDEFTGEFVRRKEHLSAGKLQEHYTVLDEKLFDNCTTSPKNLPGYSNISRSTSVSPQHLQDDRDDTIKYLKASLEEHKRKSQQTIRNLKRKLKQKKSEPDFDIVISFLKSKLNKNYLDILEQMGKSNKDLLKRMILKCEAKTISKQYSPELRSFALTLHYYSPKAYNYVREKFECALPHPKTLYKWYTSVEGNPGFNTEALKSIEERCKAVDYPLFGAVIFDEMDIKSEIERVHSKVYGMVDFGEMEKYINVDSNKVAKQVLVFTVVCVNAAWKIPFAYFFIDSLKTDTKNCLF
nr:PREDICTED: uncharacterized protein LOC105679301 [Linepithema humile]